jgi:hypothetical protein
VVINLSLLLVILTIAGYYRISAMKYDIRIRNGFEMSVSMASYLFENPAAYKDGSPVKQEYNFYDSFTLHEYEKYTNDADKFVFLRNPSINSYSKQNMPKSRSELGWAFILRCIFPDKITGSVNMARHIVKFNLFIELIIIVLLFFIGKKIAGILGAITVSLLYALFMTAVHMMCYVTYYYWAIPFSVFSLFFWIVLYSQPPYPQYFKKKLILFFLYGVIMGFGSATRMVLLFLPLFLSPFIFLKERKVKITFILMTIMLAGQFLLLLPQMFVNKQQFGRFALSTRETWHQFFMGIGSRQNPLGIENSGDFAAFDYIKKTTGVDYFKDGIDAYNKASQKQALKIIKENPKLLMHNAIENIKAAQLINPTAFYAIDTPFNKFTSFADIQLVNFYSLNAFPFLKKYFIWMVLLAALLLLLRCRERFLLFLIIIAQSIYLILVVCLYFPNYLYFMSGYIPAWIVLVGLSTAIILREPILYFKSLTLSKIKNK